MRLDKYLFDNQMSKSRTHAAELVLAGYVTVNGKTMVKPSLDVSDDDEIRVLFETCPYVSRGGFKLEAALNAFKIDPSGMTALDVGASTGGFTDVLLQKGVSMVYAVDSGHGQLDKKLLSDPRVVSFEGTNARYISRESLGTDVDIAVCDVSFISQTMIHSAVYKCLKDGGLFVGLVKPQFECGRSALSKKGIVKNQSLHVFCAENIIDSLIFNGFTVTGFCRSPICGGDGNTEYLICAVKGKSDFPLEREIIRRVVFEERSNTSEKR